MQKSYLVPADSFPNVQFRYGCTIQSLQQTDSNVFLDVGDRVKRTTYKEEFDSLFACDGLRSANTRHDPVCDRAQFLKSVNVFVAFFSIPARPQDRPFATLDSALHEICIYQTLAGARKPPLHLTYCSYNQMLHDAREARIFEFLIYKYIL